jgi:nitrogen fixation protein
MVVTLKNGGRLELRAIPKFRTIYDYIEEKMSPEARKTSSTVTK